MNFILSLEWDDLTPEVQNQARLNCLDLLGVGAGGAQTRASSIMCAMVEREFTGNLSIPFTSSTASASGVALALATTIDALDGHDGYNPAKGHIGCSVIGGLIGLGQAGDVTGKEFLAALVVGYEIGARAAVIQHQTCADYHGSGSWGAVAVAAAGARMFRLSEAQTRHALGIAEYHGPRAPMMRCIAHPTMIKDSSGQGALAGTMATLLAKSGFTGAPAAIANPSASPWDDLGKRWATCEQYYKPWPVCRWAQAPIEGVLRLRRMHQITPEDVVEIRIETFHEAVRLACTTPANTEEAQYSTAFPVAIAMYRGDVSAADIMDDAVLNPELPAFAQRVKLTEDETANANFPARRPARVTILCTDGRLLDSGWVEPPWGPDCQPSPAKLRRKFHALADPVLGRKCASDVSGVVDTLAERSLSDLCALLAGPVRESTMAGSS